MESYVNNQGVLGNKISQMLEEDIKNIVSFHSHQKNKGTHDWKADSTTTNSKKKRANVTQSMRMMV